MDVICGFGNRIFLAMALDVRDYTRSGPDAEARLQEGRGKFQVGRDHGASGRPGRTGQPIEANGEPIKAGEIRGGWCFPLRVVGNTDNLEPAALYLYRDWLPTSGEEARDFPVYRSGWSFFPELPEHEAVAKFFCR